jgi:hydrogenase nickel incorporation protein HypA/HybF
MHELPITESILKIAVNAAGGRPISVINLRIGELASIVDDSVQFYFDILSKGTLAEGATLRFDRQPATAICKACDHTFQPTIPLTPVCPQCASPLISVTGGREMRVDSIEVAD